MVKFLLGFILGYWVASNKETVIKYWEKFKEMLKTKNIDNN